MRADRLWMARVGQDAAVLPASGACRLRAHEPPIALRARRPLGPDCSCRAPVPAVPACGRGPGRQPLHSMRPLRSPRHGRNRPHRSQTTTGPRQHEPHRSGSPPSARRATTLCRPHAPQVRGVLTTQVVHRGIPSRSRETVGRSHVRHDSVEPSRQRRQTGSSLPLVGASSPQWMHAGRGCSAQSAHGLYPRRTD